MRRITKPLDDKGRLILGEFMPLTELEAPDDAATVQAIVADFERALAAAQEWFQFDARMPGIVTRLPDGKVRWVTPYNRASSTLSRYLTSKVRKYMFRISRYLERKYGLRRIEDTASSTGSSASDRPPGEQGGAV